MYVWHSHCICLSIIIVKLINMGKSYYPQLFVEECLYNFKETKSFSLGCLIIFSNDSGEEDYEEE